MTGSEAAAPQLATAPVATPVPLPGVDQATPQPVLADALPSDVTLTIDGVPRRRVRGTALLVYPVALFGSTFGWSVQSDAAEGILDNYTAGGGNFVQTSDHHSQGASERMVGEWMRRRRNRDAMVLSSTVGRTAASGRRTAAELVAATEQTLRRLGTDRIDLMNLHGSLEEVSVHEGLAAAQKLIAAGKVRHVIANDMDADRLLQARLSAAHLGAPRFTAAQTTYNLLAREPFESRLAPLAALQDLSVMPKHALANGFLTGVYRSKEKAVRSERGAIAMQHLDRHGSRVLAALDRIAVETDAELATIALAWLLSRPLVLAPVVSAGSPRQVASLLAAPLLTLDEAQLALLDRASAAPGR